MAIRQNNCAQPATLFIEQALCGQERSHAPRCARHWSTLPASTQSPAPSCWPHRPLSKTLGKACARTMTSAPVSTCGLGAGLYSPLTVVQFSGGAGHDAPRLAGRCGSWGQTLPHSWRRSCRPACSGSACAQSRCTSGSCCRHCSASPARDPAHVSRPALPDTEDTAGCCSPTNSPKQLRQAAQKPVLGLAKRAESLLIAAQQPEQGASRIGGSPAQRRDAALLPSKPCTCFEE